MFIRSQAVLTKSRSFAFCSGYMYKSVQFAFPIHRRFNFRLNDNNKSIWLNIMKCFFTVHSDNPVMTFFLSAIWSYIDSISVNEIRKVTKTCHMTEGSIYVTHTRDIVCIPMHKVHITIDRYNNQLKVISLV